MSVASTLSALRRILPLLAPNDRRLAYIGADDMSNLGDRAMFDVYRLLFDDWVVEPFPAGTKNRVLHLYDTVYQRPPVQAVLLGGGTLIGRNAYLRRLQAFYDKFPHLPRYALGTGVEDPAFGHDRTSQEQLRRWATVLHDFDFVGVRGPRSLEILSDVGLEPSVVGDTALVLAEEVPGEPESGLIGLNAGWVTDLWGDDLGELLQTLSEFAGTVVDRGRTLRVFTTWDADRTVCRELASTVSPEIEVVTPATPHELMDAVRHCEVVVGVKLHAVVLAAAVNVPTVMIDYRPKCSDFHDSIGMGDYTVRTDEISAGFLSEAVEQLSTNRSAIVNRTNQRVQELKSRLVDLAASAEAELAAMKDSDERRS